MNLRKIILILSIIIILVSCITLNVFAGTYTTTASMSVTPGAPTATVTNNAGTQWTDNVFRFSSPQANVTKIDWRISISANQSMQIWYTLDGTTFTTGAIVNFTANVYQTVTISFASPKTIYGMLIGPSTSTWTGYSLSYYPTTLTYTLTDNTAPSISATAPTTWGTTNTITTSISDSQSGVSIKKWASGMQSASYFSSGGTTFSGSTFVVSANGWYTIYAEDVAGNTNMAIVYVSYVDTTVPSISASASTTYATSNIITTSISDSQSGIAVKKWANGSQPLSYFSTGGTTFTGNTITVYTNGYYTIYAKDNAGNSRTYSINVSYVDSSITMTHPINVGYTINPNNTSPFVGSDITFTNNSRIYVLVSIQQLKATSGGCITLNDVPPTKYADWSKLNRLQTKSDIALGLKIKETETGPTTWDYIINSSAFYAANISSKIPLGYLNPNGAIGNLSLTAYCGLAWDNSYTSVHNLILVFDAF